MTAQQPEANTYVLDNALLEHARERLAAGAEWLDPWTIGHLERIGVGPGWVCLEAGAGGGTIAQWLCDRVGDAGQVVATDIDTRFVGELRYPNLRVERHDVTTDDLPGNAFDLVHARLLLEHLRSPDLVLSRLVAAVKPGGWLLVEDFDHLTCGVIDPAQKSEYSSAYKALWSADLKSMEAHGISLDLGRRLFSMSRACGLVHVESEGHVSVSRGGSAYGRFLYLGFKPFRASYLKLGLTDEQVDGFLSAVRDPEFVMMSHLLVAVWGRKPIN